MRNTSIKLPVWLLALTMFGMFAVSVHAVPRMGRNCATCHIETSGRAEIINYDSMTDLGTQLDGQSLGSLKTYDVVAGEVATFTFNVTDGSKDAAPTVLDLEKGGQQNSLDNRIDYSLRTAWKAYDTPVFYSQIFHGVTQATYNFSIEVKDTTPSDYYVIDLQVGGLYFATGEPTEYWLESELVYLHVLPPVICIDGDVNCDGEVGLLDLDIMGRHWGQTGVTREQGDLNGNGSVTLLDLDILGANWGNVLTPEPASFALLSVGLLVGLRRK